MGIDGKKSGNHESFHMCIVYSCRQAMINHLMLKNPGVIFAEVFLPAESFINKNILRFTPSVMERFGAVGYPYSQHDYK
jgi:hypothetical protein